MNETSHPVVGQVVDCVHHRLSDEVPESRKIVKLVTQRLSCSTQCVIATKMYKIIIIIDNNNLNSNKNKIIVVTIIKKKNNNNNNNNNNKNKRLYK